MVTTARERGLPVAIYRLGCVTGDRQSGRWNTADFVCRMVKGCVQLGALPDEDVMIDLTPVDYVSQALVHLSQQASALGKTFHLVNPHPMHWSDIADWLMAQGYVLKRMPYTPWYAQLAASPHNAFVPLLCQSCRTGRLSSSGP